MLELAPSAELATYDFTDVVKRLRHQLLCKITGIVPFDDNHPVYEKVYDIANAYQGVFKNGGEWLVIELESGYKLVLFDPPDCCARHYFEFPTDDIAHVVGSTLVAVLADETSHTQEGDRGSGDVIESMTLMLMTDRLQVRFPIYNSHNGYYGGLDPQMIILDSNNGFVGVGAIPRGDFDQLELLGPKYHPVLSRPLEPDAPLLIAPLT